MLIMTLHRPAIFQPLTGIYEPSAIQQLPDGRFLVVEDDKQHPFSLVTIHPDGSVSSAPLGPGCLEEGEAFWKLNDLEGLAVDLSGNLYAITSHSRDSAGDEKKSRNKLVRFRIEDDRVVDLQVVIDFKPALLAAHPLLAAASEILDVKAEGGLNIEALEYCEDTQHLLIGFRSPLLDHQAIIASLENPAAVVEDDASPRISSTLITLNLDGMGIRGMAFMPSLSGYLVIAGPVAREQVQFHLWFWSGRPGEPPRRVTVAGLHGFEHAEGVSAAILDGQQRIVIVSDDGSRRDGRYARFLLLDPNQLQMEP
jgi:Protein of unknown function (DUF3616)